MVTYTKQCRYLDPEPPSAFGRSGDRRAVNEYPTTCFLCHDELRPGEAIIGGRDDDTGRFQWICGSARWDRP
jgi:hypothetical protein